MINDAPAYKFGYIYDRVSGAFDEIAPPHYGGFFGGSLMVRRRRTVQVVDFFAVVGGWG
jgi:hypothetical protein